MSVAPEHHWPVPPPGGYTADDLDRLPDLPPHTELIDGSLVFMSPQTKFHMRVVNALSRGLEETAPEHLEVLREINVIIGRRQRPEPDVMVARAAADTGDLQTAYQAEDIVLAVEVVSPESAERDQDTKPVKYAKAGIRHFWRVERGEDGLPAVYVYELDPATGTYAVSGIHHNRLKLSVPFDIDIDLTAIRR
jgi:Uma2 family endonuclease